LPITRIAACADNPNRRFFGVEALLRITLTAHLIGMHCRTSHDAA
jgi:hypothetical protein